MLHPSVKCLDHSLTHVLDQLAVAFLQKVHLGIYPYIHPIQLTLEIHELLFHVFLYLLPEFLNRTPHFEVWFYEEVERNFGRPYSFWYAVYFGAVLYSSL